MRRRFTFASLIIFSLSSFGCKEQKSYNEQKTPEGEDFRKAYSFKDGSKEGDASILLNQSSSSAIGNEKECEDGQFLFNGLCYELEDFQVTYSGTEEAPLANLEVGATCDDSSCESYSFRAISVENEVISEDLVAVYGIHSEGNGLLLTASKNEREFYIARDGYSGGEVRFYVPPGSVGSNVKLSRFVTSAGNWVYKKNIKDTEGETFQVTFGSVF